MRKRIQRVVGVVLFVGFWVGWAATTARDEAMAQKHTPIIVTRLFTGPDGQTHAEELQVPLKPGAGPTEDLSEIVKVTGLQFRRTSPEYLLDWHTAPRRQYVITLSGRGEIELAGGKKIARRLGTSC
jgi:hypothetical protein